MAALATGEGMIERRRTAVIPEELQQGPKPSTPKNMVESSLPFQEPNRVRRLRQAAEHVLPQNPTHLGTIIQLDGTPPRMEDIKPV
jgi:hypothetical protein